MTSAEFKTARRALGLSVEACARVLRVASGRTVQRWEAGDASIPGPVEVSMDLLLHVPKARERLGLVLVPRSYGGA